MQIPHLQSFPLQNYPLTSRLQELWCTGTMYIRLFSWVYLEFFITVNGRTETGIWEYHAGKKETNKYQSFIWWKIPRLQIVYTGTQIHGECLHVPVTEGTFTIKKEFFIINFFNRGVSLRSLLLLFLEYSDILYLFSFSTFSSNTKCSNRLALSR